ncbi:Arginyl tRNA synthetase anticodon binding protein [Trichormus variabilis ATCC 29413]|uniref:Arginyl tRNA synthetase anticodon binding protein n=2 Tax=Anabaena variabilis TaxID=264691 RepID=Q3MCB3_TRIV2|nr:MULTISPECIES: DALR anticodon-binding domain-containing protein [Nostocaceae]ABA21373.1 Arginyl tRNA synthetase anticodon binding protein [Trichormus variabilis ATCC 29413]MBC1213627.1 glutamate acetyltransferase [Trichormus variabilis ARAD]MBC1254957.1 glutamate acetyltransferase [Trichormus variabilis V5]MBC1268252.1 glutamate acetyltransferase [Trichormus variabilis FSR]MBC1302085.1 glutamate acetyltransferase [Trichormus variabilis N2B]MBC1327719.1 glutamate acetyltransferase [Trichormu
MYHPLLVSKNTAIRQLLYSYLLVVVDSFNSHQEQQSTIKAEIPLYKGRDSQRILYICGVALRLAKSHNRDPMEIASVITSRLLDICKENLLVRIVDPGWIHLELADSLLAAWLQNLSLGGLGDDRDTKENERFVTIHPSRLFAMQYAHARCCSLILLAQRGGLILFREPLPDNWQELALGSLASTMQIPWLNGEAKIRLNHPAESCLISELIQVVDSLIFPHDDKVMNWEKLGSDLSQAFGTFWSQCRIWGEVKTTLPEVTQARLGLILATQTVFRFLLVTKLGSVAPLEL